MTTQLPRQLELNINALSRGFRQALRFALKHDPQGTEETSSAWKAVAARQAMLLNMLSAVGQFLNPQPVQPAPELAEPQAETFAPAPETPEPSGHGFTLLEACNEAVAEPEPKTAAGPTDEELLATLPPDLLRLREKLFAAMKWPTNNRQQARRKVRELESLQGALETRYKQWRDELMAAPG